MATESSPINKIRQVIYTTYAAFPTGGLLPGDLAYATDRLVLYRWSGAAWQATTIHSSSGLAAAIPTAANLPNGSVYFATDSKVLSQVQAGAWAAIGATNTELEGLKVGNNLRNSNDAEKSDSYDVYTKLKEVLLNADLAVCRLKFDLKSSSAETAYAKVYKNGVAIGNEQSNNTTSYVTKSQDFAGWVTNDLIQIYCNIVLVNTYYVQNMRFYYDPDDNITHLLATELVTPLPLVTARDPTISVTNQDP